jgi:carbonic anhydrase
MTPARPLPACRIRRHPGRKATTAMENRARDRHPAEDGRHPRARVISCCDSRVHATSIFGADRGAFVIHRTVASLVPPRRARRRAARHLGGGGVAAAPPDDLSRRA